MEKRWLRVRRRLFGFAAVISLLIIISGLAAVLGSGGLNPLQSSDFLYLNDNYETVQVALWLKNAGWLPLYIDEVALDSEGMWRVTALGWLKETQPEQAFVTTLPELSAVETPLSAGESGQLLLEFWPDQRQGKQQLEIRYHNFLGLSYTLVLATQAEDLIGNGE